MRVVASATFFVVGATVTRTGAARYFLFALGFLVLLAAITGYGPLYPYISRLTGTEKQKP